MRDEIEEYADTVRKFPSFEREELASALVEYSKTKSKQLEDKLVKGNMRLVMKIIFDLKRRGAYFPVDVVQEGMVGLITAVRRFDPSRGNRFSTYAHWWIRAHIYQWISKNRVLSALPQGVVPDMVSIDMALAPDFTVGDTIDSGAIPVDEQVDRKLRFEKMARVVEQDAPANEAFVFENRMMNDRLSQVEIAEIYGHSRQRVHQIESQLIERLKEEFL